MTIHNFTRLSSLKNCFVSVTVLFFQTWDKNKDGTIDEKELKDALRCSGYNKTAKEFDEMFKKYNKDSEFKALSNQLFVNRIICTVFQSLNGVFSIWQSVNEGFQINFLAFSVEQSKWQFKSLQSIVNEIH